MRALGSPTILVADDSDAYRRGIVRSIETTGGMHLVAEVTTGVDALNALVELQPDVALIDVRMPGLDGLEVCSRFRAEHPDSATVLVLISAHPDTSLQAQAWDVGVNVCLSKQAPRREVCDVLLRQVSRAARPAQQVVRTLDAGVLRETLQLFGPETVGLLEDWWSGATADVALLDRHAAAGDRLAAANAAHDICGSASVFGATRVMHVAGAIEQQLRHGTEDVAEAVAILRVDLAAVHAELLRAVVHGASA